MTEHKQEVALLHSSQQPKSPTLNPINVLEDRKQNNIASITLKCGDAFLVADVCGNFLASQPEMGLYRHGTRFLRTCNLYLEGQTPIALSHQVATMGHTCHVDMTNVSFQTADQRTIEQGTLHIHRFIELEQDTLVQTFALTNFDSSAVSVQLTITIGSDFCDLFEVRGLERKHHGEMLPPSINDDTVCLRYKGLDQIERTSSIQITPKPPSLQANRLDWLLYCEPGKTQTVRMALTMHESSSEKLETQPATTLWRQTKKPVLQSSDPLFDRLLSRGMQDLMMLSTMTKHGYYPYAGIPWFSCPFGRDGLLTAIEFLPWFPEIARGTLQFLAHYQGRKVDSFTDEEPGKILHEFRTGEMAHCREIPYIPYYGTVDATPLFLVLLEGYIRWTNDLELLDRLWPNAEAAARWLQHYGDRDGDTFIEFHCASEKGLANQGWKDAFDSTSHSDGRLAHSPMALCEVQGYAYAAYRAMAYLARRLGKNQDIAQWEQSANTLQTNFVRDFWWEQEQVFYMGLAAHKEPCDIVTSNAGQCLWTGIVPEHLAQKMITRLMGTDMISGWGMRTLSTQARRYNPMSYHNGSVWPHDNGLIGMGMALYGAKKEAAQILKELFDASMYFEGNRLPELYCGFPRRDGYGPTRYPVSCSPQAWAAGAPFALLNGLLGLHPDAEQQRLVLDRPTLPEWLPTLEIDNFYVGNARVHLRFQHCGDHIEVIQGRHNEVAVRVLR